jgi:hypothetical protein
MNVRPELLNAGTQTRPTGCHVSIMIPDAQMSSLGLKYLETTLNQIRKARLSLRQCTESLFKRTTFCDLGFPQWTVLLLRVLGFETCEAVSSSSGH